MPCPPQLRQGISAHWMWRAIPARVTTRHRRGMMSRNPLPTDLPSAFRVADARAANVSRRRLLGKDLHPTFHGIRSSGRDRRAALVPVMRAGYAFAGPTAAQLWDLPLPAMWADDPRLFVACPGPGRIRRPGVVSSRRPDLDCTRLEGLPVLSPTSTWVSLGGLLSVPDLTAIGDRLVSGTLKKPPLCSLGDLRGTLDAAGSIPGIRALRAAIDDVRVGAWSRPETLLRLLMIAAGLPEPVLNQPVLLLDGDVVYPDLAWPERRVAVEYDGSWHENAGQRSRDLARHEKLIDAGWLVVHVRRTDLFVTPSALIARLVSRLRDRGFALAAPIEWARMPCFVP